MSAQRLSYPGRATGTIAKLYLIDQEDNVIVDLEQLYAWAYSSFYMLYDHFGLCHDPGFLISHVSYIRMISLEYNNVAAAEQGWTEFLVLFQ